MRRQRDEIVRRPKRKPKDDARRIRHTRLAPMTVHTVALPHPQPTPMIHATSLRRTISLRLLTHPPSIPTLTALTHPTIQLTTPRHLIPLMNPTTLHNTSSRLIAMSMLETLMRPLNHTMLTMANPVVRTVMSGREVSQS